jgi:hypothetical protein
MVVTATRANQVAHLDSTILLAALLGRELCIKWILISFSLLFIALSLICSHHNTRILRNNVNKTVLIILTLFVILIAWKFREN